MTTAILLVGLGVVAAIAVAMVRPAWRVPALAFAFLAVPGNVDDLLPQMVLDPHQLPNATAPIVASIDLLLAWAVLLTLRERRRLTPGGSLLVLAAVLLAAAAWVVVAAANLGGVDPAASMRGAIVFARVPALLYLGYALRSELGEGSILGVAILLGGVVLLGNGVYTTLSTGVDRFTGSTFGRNGLAIALIVVVVVGTGLAYRWWRDVREGAGPVRWIAPVAIVVGSMGLFGAAATGTRMALVVLVAAAVAAFAFNPYGLNAIRLRAIAASLVVAFTVLLASVLWTTAGGRTVSVFTDADAAADIVTQPGTVPTDPALRTRGDFWRLAVEMVRSAPLAGVGPFQWNFRRYDLDPQSPVVVADTHNTYLQIGAEYGLGVAAGYVVLLTVALGTIAWRSRTRAGRRALGWAGLAIVIGAYVFPLADLTNSHLFNVRNGALEWLMIAAALGLTSTLSAGSGTQRGAATPSE